MVICILYGRYCRHCLICRLLLYNNFKRGGNVTGQCLFNVPDVTLVPNFGRILVASLSNVNVASCYGAIIGILWIIGCSLQGTVLNMFSSVFNVVKYNSDIVL